MFRIYGIKLLCVYFVGVVGEVLKIKVMNEIIVISIFKVVIL